MAVTVSGLLNCAPAALYDVASGCTDAAAAFSEGAVTYGERVELPLAAAHGWSGAGQPEAATVTRTMSLAMGIGDVRMVTASNAALGLYYALNNARNTVRSQLARPEIQRFGWQVNDDGTVGDYYGTSQASTELTEIRDEIERTLLGAIAYTQAADQTAGAVFQRVTSSTPRYGDIADPGALAANEQLSVDALTDLDNSRAVLDLWRNTQVQPISKEAHDPVLRFIHEHGGLILDLLSFVPYLGVVARVGKGILAGKRVVEEISESGASAAPKQQVAQPPSREYVPDWARATYDAYRGQKYRKLPGTAGKSNYGNDPKRAYTNEKGEPDGTGRLGEKLPEKTSNGETIEYREYDVNIKPPKDRGPYKRDDQRIVVGYVRDPNGEVTLGTPPTQYREVNAYYTNDHYRHFAPITP